MTSYIFLTVNSDHHSLPWEAKERSHFSSTHVASLRKYCAKSSVRIGMFHFNNYRRVPNKCTCLNKCAPSILWLTIALKIDQTWTQMTEIWWKNHKMKPRTTAVLQGVSQRAGCVYSALYGILGLDFSRFSSTPRHYWKFTNALRDHFKQNSWNCNRCSVHIDS